MNFGHSRIRKPVNEPILTYLPGSKEKLELKDMLNELKDQVMEIPLVIGGEAVKTGNLKEVRIPHNHGHILAKYHLAGEKELLLAKEKALEAKGLWQSMPMDHRAAIFLKAAQLISGPYRALLNGATMLGQSKNVFQAEIDSACEIIDFLRFNVNYMQEIYAEQPESVVSEWNRLEYRPLEGFVLAITPFNFTAIGGNLPTAPAMMGNTVIWKPSNNAVYSNYIFMSILEEAGLPAGVINFVPSLGDDVEKVLLKDKDLAGVHFTGSSKVFSNIYRTIGENVDIYKSFPRIVGETGGKDFVFAHPSADVDSLSVALVRGAFEFQGQKCSAASRAYIPISLFDEVYVRIKEMTDEITIGDTEDFRNLVNAVIDKKAFDKIAGYIEWAKEDPDSDIIIGGTYDDSKGYFIKPTVILTKNPKSKTMEEEIFGPVLTLYVYEDDMFDNVLALCDDTSPYGLTGAIFARDREIIERMSRVLYQSAGNFYINDKPTGAVVGQQPFGGGRKSGTNDKAGSKLNLLRWVNVRNIKENYTPPKSYKYGFMIEE